MLYPEYRDLGKPLSVNCLGDLTIPEWLRLERMFGEYLVQVVSVYLWRRKLPSISGVNLVQLINNLDQGKGCILTL